jgi:hypothetical protein
MPFDLTSIERGGEQSREPASGILPLGGRRRLMRVLRVAHQLAKTATDGCTRTLKWASYAVVAAIDLLVVAPG